MCTTWSLLPPRSPPHFPPSSSLLCLHLISSILASPYLAPPSLPPTAPLGQSERGVEQSYAIPGCVAARAITICVVVAPWPARDLSRVPESVYVWSRGKAAKVSRERGPSRALQCLLGKAPKAPRELQEGPPDPSWPSKSSWRGPTGPQEGSATALGGPQTEPTNPADPPSALKGPREGQTLNTN